MKTVDVLRAARAKIEKPENWTQEVTARDSYGSQVNSNDLRATCWCAYGAISAVCADPDIENDAVGALVNVVEGGLIGAFNDTHSHAEVLAMFDKAIALVSA